MKLHGFMDHMEWDFKEEIRTRAIFLLPREDPRHSMKRRKEEAHRTSGPRAWRPLSSSFEPRGRLGADISNFLISQESFSCHEQPSH